MRKFIRRFIRRFRTKKEKENSKNKGANRFIQICFILSAALILIITSIPEIRGITGEQSAEKETERPAAEDSAASITDYEEEIGISESGEGEISDPEESGTPESGVNLTDAEENAPDRTESGYLPGETVPGLYGTCAIVLAADGRTSLCIGTDPQWYEEPEAVVYTAEYLTESDEEFLFILAPGETEDTYRIFSAADGGTRCLTWDPGRRIFVLREREEENQVFQLVYAGEDCYLIQTADGAMLGLETAGKDSSAAEDGLAEQEPSGGTAAENSIGEITEGQPVTAMPYEAYRASVFETWRLLFFGNDESEKTGTSSETSEEEHADTDSENGETA